MQFSIVMLLLRIMLICCIMLQNVCRGGVAGQAHVVGVDDLLDDTHWELSFKVNVHETKYLNGYYIEPI